MNLPPDEYLKPTATIDCETRSITEQALQLTKGQEETADKAEGLFYFVRDEIKYNPYAPRHLPEHYRASAILDMGEGYCVQKAVLLAALARAIGIPARLGFADIRNHLPMGNLAEVMGTNLFVYHGYDELHIEGRWIRATPTFDLKMCRENRILPVEFDGKKDAMLHSHNQDGKLHIEYVRRHGHYADLPWYEIQKARAQAYGPDLASRLMRLEPPRHTLQI